MIHDIQDIIIHDNPYEFDTDKNGFPTFTHKNMKFIQVLIHNDSNYRDSFNPKYKGSSANFLDNYFPKNREDLQKAIESINRENSTHLSVKKGIEATVEAIIHMGLDTVSSRIQKGEAEIVNELAAAVKSRLNFSFASKFCTYCNRYCFKKDDYSIFDNVVAGILAYYAYVYTGEKHWKSVSGKNARNESIIRDEFASKEKPDYFGYNSLIGRILERVKAVINPSISRKDFDGLLWYYYKGNPHRILRANTYLGKENE